MENSKNLIIVKDYELKDGSIIKIDSDNEVLASCITSSKSIPAIVFDKSKYSIGMLSNKNYNECNSAICVILSEVQSMAKTDMTHNEFKILADNIIEDYPQFKIEEVKLIVRSGWKGEFGENFGKINGSTIYLWINKYKEKRAKEIEEIRKKEQKAYRDQLNEPLASNETWKKFREMYDERCRQNAVLEDENRELSDKNKKLKNILSR